MRVIISQCRDQRQYFLTFQVSRNCLLTLLGSRLIAVKWSKTTRQGIKSWPSDQEFSHSPYETLILHAGAMLVHRLRRSLDNNPCASEMFVSIFHPLKLTLPILFPASNDEKDLDLFETNTSQFELFDSLNICHKMIYQLQWYFIWFNPFLPKVSDWNCHPLEVVSRYRDPQLQVGENYSYSFNLRPNIWKSWCLNTHFIPSTVI